jgi:hypothetical protein
VLDFEENTVTVCLCDFIKPFLTEEQEENYVCRIEAVVEGSFFEVRTVERLSLTSLAKKPV